jgi:hypothetical protein
VHHQRAILDVETCGQSGCHETVGSNHSYLAVHECAKCHEGAHE